MTEFSTQRTMMVDTQIRPSDVTKYPIIDAMLRVERERFVPDANRETAYMDGAIQLGTGRAMLEPRVLAKLLDALDISGDELVLDIGIGHGYSSAIVSRMAEAVVGVEEDEALAAEAEAAIAGVEADNVAVIHAPLADGAAKHGPFDVLLLQGSVEDIPAPLIAQLKDGGRIGAIFTDGALGVARIGHKRGESVDWRDVFNASAEILPGFERAREFQL